MVLRLLMVVGVLIVGFGVCLIEYGLICFAFVDCFSLVCVSSLFVV